MFAQALLFYVCEVHYSLVWGDTFSVCYMLICYVNYADQCFIAHFPLQMHTERVLFSSQPRGLALWKVGSITDRLISFFF